MFKRFFKSTNGRIIAISVLVALVGAGVIGIMMLINNNKNKSIVVTEVNGTVDVIGLKNSGQAKKGQRFLNGEDVTVKEDSGLTFCLNNDKYAYVDANTHFRLETDSSNKGTNTKIVLDKGSERNVLMSKLKDGDSYEVDTPNSTMSVRGTIFRITVYTGSDGYVYTFVEVESGVVRVKLKDFSGEYTGVERDFHSGESGIIRGNLSSSEFLLTEDGEESRILNYAELPGDAVERLVALLDEYKVKDKIDEPEDNVTELASADTDTGEEGGEDANKEEDKDSQETKNTESKDNNTKETKETKDNKDTKDTKDNKDNKNNNNNNNNNKDTAKDNKTTKDNNTTNNTDNNNNTDTNSNGGNTNSGNNNSQPSHTHSWKEVIDKAATCTTEGSKHNECSCGEKTAAVAIPATGAHNWQDVVDKNATCSSEGSKHQECSVCKTVKPDSTSSIPATGVHSFVWTTVTEAKCEGEGKEKQVCSFCGTEGEERAIPPKGHNFVEKTISSSDDEGAVIMTYRECSVCGQRE